MLRVLVVIFFAVVLVVGGGGTRAAQEPHRVRTRSVHAINLNWNSIVDVILDLARREIVRQNLDEVALEDVEENFRRKWSFILIDSRFVANGGKLKSLSSIERSGNASVSVNDDGNNVYTLACDVTMRVAKIRYDNYDVEMWQQSILSGEISGNIANNRMRVVLDFEMKDDGCATTLREVTVQEIGGFEVEVTGLGPLDELASQISTWVSQKRKGQIIKEIQYYLSMEIRKALEDFHCDEYAGVLMVSF